MIDPKDVQAILTVLFVLAGFVGAAILGDVRTRRP